MTCIAAKFYKAVVLCAPLRERDVEVFSFLAVRRISPE